ncbi:Sapep family Mn(2+)-dependent dipeptidase [Vibrio mediterranei]|uniref:Sapep family Mn(2+)-dependent dipeptidase n=1 Tax=Vibrio barjaei TaxID=1676683 RepID=A0ABW7IL50_9VIBR|nr:Sapep family Mn(2+)-dependent dipeptidase [Vibrio mediterranei]MCG9627220.1 Sapep family Mn(2+)-dependent dipeptidase [Vibrio mediterranei]MCG9786501.1 Sapep family Mn(2+)-dependent dipeptidase [Vibrio mediterranei]
MTERIFSRDFIKYFDIDEFINDLAGLIAIPSVRDMTTRKDNAPFGQPIRDAFDYLIQFAEREGLDVRDHQGYALDISIGEGEKEIGILHHVDVVAAGNSSLWKTPPFELRQQRDLLFGRGVTDNKGPLLASLYILKLFKQFQVPLTHRVRVIIGGAEETTWECVEHYFNHNPQPDLGFSPDGDFPIVNGEKGILYAELLREFPAQSDSGSCQIVQMNSQRDRTSTCYQLEILLSGQQAEQVAHRFVSVAEISKQKELVRVVLTTPWEKSRNPHRVPNCMDAFVAVMREVDGLDENSQQLVDLLDRCFADSIDGKKLGLAHLDEEMGSTSCCVSAINFSQCKLTLDFDFRFPKGLDLNDIRTQLQCLSQKHGVSIKEQQYLPLSYLSPESDLIQAMGKAYFDVTGMEAQCFSKGAASYARALTNGVAFGPTFPGDVTHVHESNEQLSLESLRKAITIYVKILISLQE